MDLSGEYRIPTDRETVWAALNDPQKLKASIEGCEALEQVSDTEFTAKLTAKVGPVKAKFTGKVTLSEIDAPNGYTISGEGQGGVAGFAKGSAAVSLAEDNGETILTYEAQAQVGGKLAQIGSRLVKGAAKKRADSFFVRFSNVVQGKDPEAKGDAAPEENAFTALSRAGLTTPPAPEATPAAVSTGGGLPAWAWSSLLVAGTALLYALSL